MYPQPTPSVEIADRPRIGVSGVAANSRLAQLLRATLENRADLVPLGRAAGTTGLWRWLIRNTDLAWSLGETPVGCMAQPVDILLDLHGTQPVRPGRLWRIVDELGNPILAPFACITTRHAAQFVKSIYLIVGDPSDDRWTILAEAHISTRRGYRSLIARVARTIAWLVRRALTGKQIAPRPHWQSVPDRYASTGAMRALGARGASLLARVRDRVASEIWAIGRVNEPLSAMLSTRSLEPERWHEIPAADGFIADPFVWPGREGTILYERWSHRSGVGHIEAANLGTGPDDAAAKLDLRIDTHLSYPFTIVVGNEVFCLPEMAAERRQILYRLEADNRPSEYCVVAEDISMADPTLFVHDGRYWIAYNDAEDGLHENLCLLYADALAGPWTPHVNNPVKLDVRSSRPGGAAFTLGDLIYRPAQDCSKSYGCALVINRLLECSDEHYEEAACATIYPNKNGRFPDGIHTLTVTSDCIWVDGKRFVINPRILLRRLMRRLSGARVETVRRPHVRGKAALGAGAAAASAIGRVPQPPGSNHGATI